MTGMQSRLPSMPRRSARRARARRRVVVAIVVFGALLSAGPAGAAANSPLTKVTTKKNATKTTAKTTAKVTATTTAPQVAVPTTVAAPAPAPTRPAFGTCGQVGTDEGVQCALVPVPLDPANPAGDTISVFVARRPAGDQASRIGTLFINPGGPGGPTLDLVRRSRTFLTAEVLSRFDIVGVDPRGTERSAPLGCSLSAVARADLATPADGSALARQKASYVNLGKACAATDGNRLAFMDTTTAARDIDAVRAALGEDRISFLGMSYGTYLGAVYESLFPQQVRAVVLDSAIDPARFGTNQLLDPLAQSEISLDAFLAACANGTLIPCRFNDGTDLKAKYSALREKYLGTGSGRDRSEATLDTTINSLIGYPRNGWPILGRALQELADGRTPNFAATSADNLSVDNSERIVPVDSLSVATNIAISCRDGILPRDPVAYQAVVDNVYGVAPRFSGIRFNEGIATTCVSWPSPTAVLTPLRASVASTLVIANTFDPTTPIVWSRGLAAQLGAPLLIRNGGGHVAINKSLCVQSAVARFLIDGVAPPSGTVCSPDLANPS